MSATGLSLVDFPELREFGKRCRKHNVSEKLSGLFVRFAWLKPETQEWRQVYLFDGAWQKSETGAALESKPDTFF